MALFTIGLESSVVAVAILVAVVVAVPLGITAARKADPRSSDALVGLAGAALAGFLLLSAALVVVISLVGWGEWR